MSLTSYFVYRPFSSPFQRCWKIWNQVSGATQRLYKVKNLRYFIETWKYYQRHQTQINPKTMNVGFQRIIYFLSFIIVLSTSHGLYFNISYVEPPINPEYGSLSHWRRDFCYKNTHIGFRQDLGPPSRQRSGSWLWGSWNRRRNTPLKIYLRRQNILIFYVRLRSFI